MFSGLYLLESSRNYYQNMSKTYWLHVFYINSLTALICIIKIDGIYFSMHTFDYFFLSSSQWHLYSMLSLQSVNFLFIFSIHYLVFFIMHWFTFRNMWHIGIIFLLPVFIIYLFYIYFLQAAFHVWKLKLCSYKF